MSDKSERKVPELAVPRLSQYYRALLETGDRTVISSEELALLTGYGAPQIRRDLTYFGQFGTPGRGYNVADLKSSLARILGLDKDWTVALVGVGNLGAALLGYKGFRRAGFRLVAAFDKDPAKVGQTLEGVPVHDEAVMAQVTAKEGIRMAVLTVPAAAAQDAADKLAAAGVKALLNFAPVRLRVPADVTVHTIDVAIELERLSFLTIHQNPKGGATHG
jgi:redox-sensing transcriptional repressor